MSLGAGFGFLVMGTDAFGDEPATAAFETKITAEFNEPIFRFVFDGRTYDDYIIGAPTVSRGGDIIAGTANIVLSNTPKARIDGVGIAFVDSNPDTITDAGNGFITAGFEDGDRITVLGSVSNDGDYRIATVTAGTLTLTGAFLLTEGAAPLVSILAEPVFNFFVADRISNMGKPCHVGIYFSGTTGYLYLMTGTVEEVSYNGAKITLSIRDKMAPMLEKQIGSGQSPADYYAPINPLKYNPAELAWLLLTDWGGLDNTLSTSNTDINYTSWSTWYDKCALRNYQCRARFPGMTIQNALLRIGDLTNSFIWVSGEGLFQFTMFEPPYVASGSDKTYDVDNSVSIDIDIDKSTIKNTIKIYYGHNPDTDYNPQASITSINIGFGDDNPDRIYITVGGFLAAGFDNNDPVTVSGSELNDGNYGIQSVTDGVLLLYESNGLSEEESGANVTLTQSQDTSTMRSLSFVFNDTGSNDTITDVTEGFVVGGITANDSITIVGSVSNDGTYAVDSVTANTITLAGAETLVQEASGADVTLTQTHSITLTATTIAFNDNETGKAKNEPADSINKSDGSFVDTGFLPQYQVTVTGSTLNDSTYRLADVTSVQLTLLHQSLEGESSGATVTITQSHTLSTTGKQFESFITGSNAESIALYGSRPLTDEDKVIWHANRESAAAAATAKLAIYRYPSEFVRIVATMEGFLSKIGDRIHVTEPHKNINDQTYFIKEVDINVAECRTEITAER